MELSGQFHAPAALLSLNRWLDGPQSRLDVAEQRIASLYTDQATSTPVLSVQERMTLIFWGNRLLTRASRFNRLTKDGAWRTDRLKYLNYSGLFHNYTYLDVWSGIMGLCQ
jgi:hypothetical protein